MSHTAEPWYLPAGSTCIHDANGNEVPRCEQNERRKVACVNACAGEPTGALEISSYSEQVDLKVKFFEENQALKAQRDELLAAIKQSLDSMAAIIVDLADVQGVKLTKESVIKKSTNDSPVGVIRELISKIEGK